MSERRLLLDTHAFVWWAVGSTPLPAGTVEAIADADEVSVSLASFWEIVIKESTNHPMIGTPDAYRWFSEAMATTDFSTIPIEARHIAQAQHLPLHHRDPFDRLLVAQANDADLTIVTRDSEIEQYDVQHRWWN